MILSAIVKPNVQLIVCGIPGLEWVEWLRTTDEPLTDAQWAMRQSLADGETREEP